MIFFTTSTDGTSDPLNATKITYDLINDLDGGGYHPVSLVLNCQDYFFADYALGADILMQDTCESHLFSITVLIFIYISRHN